MARINPKNKKEEAAKNIQDGQQTKKRARCRNKETLDSEKKRTKGVLSYTKHSKLEKKKKKTEL